MSKSIRNLIIGLVVFVICTAVLGILCYLEFDQQAQLDKEIRALDPTISQYTARIQQREKIAADKQAIDTNFSQFVTILPAKDNLDEHKLPSLMNGFLETSGCNATSIRYSEGDRDLVGGKFTDFSRKVVDITDLTGNFNQIRELMDLIEKDGQLLRIDRFTMDKSAAGNLIQEQTPLRVSMQISLYYYDKKIAPASN